MKDCTICWIYPWTGISNMLNHDLKWSKKTMSNLVCKVNYVHTYMTMHQRNVYHSNESVSLCWHICVLHHIVYKLNTCISWSAKKLNTLSTNHIRNICYSSTNEFMSCLIKWQSSSSSLCQAYKFVHMQLQDRRLCFLL